MKNLLLLVLVIFVSFGLVGCAEMETTKYKTVYVPAPPLPPSTVEQDIDSLVAEENAYRLGLGQTILSSGLSCVLYKITGGSRIQSSIAGHNTLTGVSQVATFLLNNPFNQPEAPANEGLNLLPAFLKPLYLNLFLLRCQGQLVVRESGYVKFDLTSDDASLLYIGGTKVVDNDNAHSPLLKSGSKYLRRGVHTFRIDFAQTGGGTQALILKANDDIIHPMYLFH